MSPLPKDENSEMDRYDQNKKRPRLERERERMRSRLASITGDDRAAVEKSLAVIEAELGRLTRR
jgi:hypothetical protein